MEPSEELLDKSPSEIGLDSISIVERQIALKRRIGLEVRLSDLFGDVKLRDIPKHAKSADSSSTSRETMSIVPVPQGSFLINAEKDADKLEALLDELLPLLPEGGARVLVPQLVRDFLGRLDIADFLSVRDCRSPILLANHQSAIESITLSAMIAALLKRKVAVVAKAEHTETWLGEMFKDDLENIYFLDRTSHKSLVELLKKLRTDLEKEGKPLLVHLAGTRSTYIGQPTVSSGVFESFAAKNHLTAFPVRFVGGLPRTGTDRMDFPVGLGRQDVYVGNPVDARSLAALSAADRASFIPGRIDNLGPSRERPATLNPDLAKKVEAYREGKDLGFSESVLRVLLKR